MSQSELHTLLIGITAAHNIDELEEQFKGLFAYLDPLQGNQILWSDLRDITNVAEKHIDEIETLSDLIHRNTLERVGNLFAGLAQRIGLYVTAVSLLTKLWNRLGEYQSNLDGGKWHVYRAGVCYYLGQVCVRQGDFGQAIWWLLHAQADDTLSSPSDADDFPVGGACDFLRLYFGVNDEVFRHMMELKRGNQDEPHTLFAEHLIMQLSLNHSFANLFIHHSAELEFLISRAYAKNMLSRVDQQNKGKYEGKPLEELVRYLVLLMPGWIPTENTYHHRTDIDSDVVARYVREPESISSSHPRAILIECKNRKDPLNVAEAGYFLYRMSLTQVEIGILFVRKITGDKGNPTIDENAAHLFDLAYQQNGKVVVVVGLEDDLKEIAEGKKTLWTIIDSGIVERRFGTSTRRK